MSLRFLLGPAGSGKTHACLDEICRELVRDPLTGPPLYFLVPEQATYQMERAFLRTAEVNAAARARVVSFKRLASPSCRTKAVPTAHTSTRRGSS